MKILKLVFIGFITTVLRAMLQTFMPVGHQTVLAPSMFINNGTMPIAFILYGTFAYTVIAAIFLSIHQNMSGNRILKGLKFGLSCSLLWSIYLMEPLPHAAGIDFAYPIADSAVLIVMGLLLGRFIAASSQPPQKYKFTKHSLLNIGFVTLLFFIGRITAYTIFNIYSSFDKSPVLTIVWVIAAGIVIGLLFDYINTFIGRKSASTKSFMFGIVFFGVDLFAFNFFIPIVFDFNMGDLLIRTMTDIIFVLIGCFIANRFRSKATLVQQ